VGAGPNCERETHSFRRRDGADAHASTERSSSKHSLSDAWPFYGESGTAVANTEDHLLFQRDIHDGCAHGCMVTSVIQSLGVD
jgi:hypothetical protein